MPDPTNKIQDYFIRELTRGRLDLVDAGRVDQLIDWLKTNQVTAAEVTPNGTGDSPQVDTYELGQVRFLLENETWRRFLSDSGVHRLEAFLGVQAQSGRRGVGRDAPGKVPYGSIPGNLASRIGHDGVTIEQTAALFDHEYEQRKARLFENTRLSADERAKNLLHLLQDYAKVLNDAGDGPAVTTARRELLAAFFAKPAAKLYGGADPDDDLMSNAWEIVWGTDPERPQSNFPVDESRSWTAYMSMGGEFVPVATKIDGYLRALGRPAWVEEFEKRSPLNWIIGETAGNVKPAYTFDEARALSSTGVNFAAKLVDPGKIRGRELAPGFDMKVDFYAWANFVTLNTSAGERLVAIRDGDASKTELKVEVERVDAKHWRPVFKDAAGRVVSADEVTAVIKTSSGAIKGDGLAASSYSASWWGFCDRNAMQAYVTMKYGFPEPQKPVTLKVGGQEFVFSQDEIRKIVGRRLTEVFTQHTQAGNRFDDDPDQIYMKDGSSLSGKIRSAVDFYRSDTYRTGDLMVLTPGRHDGPVGSLLIQLADGTTRDIDAATVSEIRRSPQTPEEVRTGRTRDTLVLKDGSVVNGSLQSKLSFAEAESRQGAMVLVNRPAKPILGDVEFTTARGESKRVPLADVKLLVREDESEVLADEALAFVIRAGGMFAADSWTGSSVANGNRTVEEINRWRVGDPEKPSWVPTDLGTLSGYAGKVKDPKRLLFFSLGKKNSEWNGMKMWIELDARGVPVNSKIISGQWDFLWGVAGDPNWNAQATFNPQVPNDLVLKLYINSLDNPEAHAKLLPENWRSYLLTPQP